MLFHSLLIAGCVVLSFALRSFSHPVLFRLGNLCIVATSYLLGWFVSGYHAGGAACVGLWFLFPWIDIIGRIRHLEMPASRTIQTLPPPGPHRFPALEDLTEELEAESFERIEDVGWEYSEQRQFVRLFSHPTEPIRASINLVENDDIAFFYITLCSRSADGKIWYTWNYPFSMTLRPSPNWRIQRARDVESFLQLLEKHRSWLASNAVHDASAVSSDAAALTAQVEEEMHSQISHNEKCGVLLRSVEGFVRYSWKGCFFLWLQFLKELIRVR